MEATFLSLLFGLLISSLGVEAHGEKGHYTHVKSVVDPMLVCPKEYQLEGNGCVKVAREGPKLYCPKKSKMTEDGCTVTDHFVPQHVCPEGYTMKGKKCYRTITGPSTNVCPHDYHLVGSDCVKRSMMAAKFKCPKGYTLTGSECILAEKVSTHVVCPRGYELGKHGQCIMQQFAPPQPTCPKGYHLEGDDCIKAVVSPSHVECPKGFKLENQGRAFETCIRHEKVAAQPVCAKGEFDGKKTCTYANSVAIMAECPPGYTLASGRCTKVLEKAPEMECLDKAYTLKEGRCIKIDHTKPELSCPAGKMMEKGKCRNTEYIPVAKECSHDYIMINGQCVKEHTKSLETACPKGYHNDGMGTCKQVISVKADYICERGDMKGHSCIISESADQNLHCTQGELINNECLETIEGPVQFQCPKGYDMDVTGQCVQLQYVNPMYVCPDGTLNSIKGDCETKITSRPELSCPKGYKSRSDGNLPSQSCTKEEVIKAQYQCPAGTYLKHDMCYSAHRVEPTIKKK